jgi:hypothetical protein
VRQRRDGLQHRLGEEGQRALEPIIRWVRHVQRLEKSTKAFSE